jgi:hypothetical protein
VLKADPFDWPGAEHHHHHGADGANGDHERRTLEEVMAILKEANDRPEPAAMLTKRAGRARLPGFARFIVPESAD